MRRFWAIWCLGALTGLALAVGCGDAKKQAGQGNAGSAGDAEAGAPDSSGGSGSATGGTTSVAAASGDAGASEPVSGGASGEAPFCAADSHYCRGADVYACDVRGVSDELLEACAPGTSCDDESATCEEVVCVPGEKSCTENAVQTCSDSGHGFLEPTEDCGDQTCSLGECVTCEEVDVRKVLRFLQIRQTHIYVYNRSGCTIDLEGVGFDIAYYAPEILDVRDDYNILPSYQLGPEDFATLSFLANIPGTIYVDGAGPFNDGRDAYVTLCDGQCTGLNVMDAVQIGTAPPPLPTPVNFLGQLKPDMTTQYLSREWSFTGSYPNFMAVDWKILDE